MRTPEYAELSTVDLLDAVASDWHDRNEAGCCDDEGPWCVESKAYAQGYHAAVCSAGF